MKVIEENLENKDGDLQENLESYTDELDAERIEETLGRVMQDGKNKPFAHTCDDPSQTCECWIAVDGDNRAEHIWLSVRPNRRARRLAAAKRKEPKRNDGTPKRFERVVRRRKQEASAASEDAENTGRRVQRPSSEDSTEQRTDKSS